MIARQRHKLFVSETGFWCTSRKMSQDGGGYCLDLGMGHIESQRGMTPMSHVLRSTSPRMGRSASISRESVPVQRDSWLVITGMAARRKGQDAHRSGFATVRDFHEHWEY